MMKVSDPLREPPHHPAVRIIKSEPHKPGHPIFLILANNIYIRHTVRREMLYGLDSLRGQVTRIWRPDNRDNRSLMSELTTEAHHALRKSIPFHSTPFAADVRTAEQRDEHPARTEGL